MTAPESGRALPYTALGLGLLRELGAKEGDANAFVSPVSAGMALAMLYNGATGNTQREIGDAIGAGELTLEEVNQAARAELRSGDVELSIANALWAAKGVPFTREYLDRVRGAYGAEAAEVVFTDPATPDRINAWVSESTHGRIQEIVAAPMSGSLVLCLTNAVYFKGRWAEEFPKEATRPRDFLLADGTRKAVATMHITGLRRYLEGDGFRAVRLAYRGLRMALYVFLPDPGNSLAAFRDTLTPERWDGWMTRFQTRDVSIALPRFRAEGTFPLVEPLGKLGIRDAFDPVRASLHAMFPASYFQSAPNVFVSEAVQKTWIEVNEEGTEAAAVTLAAMEAAGFSPPPVPFVVARPFIAAVRDDDTGAILFIGQLFDPG